MDNDQLAIEVLFAVVITAATVGAAVGLALWPWLSQHLVIGWT